jgi:hypothetical protein
MRMRVASGVEGHEKEDVFEKKERSKKVKLLNRCIVQCGITVALFEELFVCSEFSDGLMMKKGNPSCFSKSGPRVW